MAQLLDDFKAITQELNARGIDYAVCGGWAMAIHGFLRATLDIDIMILTDDLATVMSVARKNGYDIESLPLNFDGGKTQIRRISKIDPASKELITLDMILMTEIFSDVWESRKRVTWNEGVYPVIAPKGMKKMKELASRPKDLIDLDYLRGLEDEDDDES